MIGCRLSDLRLFQIYRLILLYKPNIEHLQVPFEVQEAMVCILRLLMNVCRPPFITHNMRVNGIIPFYKEK
jgi:hypothetical protein